MIYDFLNDKHFLQEIDNARVKQQYVRMTILSWDEEPIAEIQGKAISGSVNISSTSNVRRTSSFSMFAEQKENDLTKIDQQLSINRKVKLQLGFLNNIHEYLYDTTDDQTGRITHHTINYQDTYGDIVWFPLGIYVIFDPQISHQVDNGVTISISLEDKMSLLNGDAGGVLPAAVTFSEVQDAYGKITHPIIRQIIFELVNHFGAEDATKIVIEDLDDRIKQVVRYTGSNALYYVQYTNNEDTYREFFLSYDEALAQAKLSGHSNPYQLITTYQYGDDIGFIMTDFTYPGQLVSEPGDTVTTVLDEIIKVLGNYEYFYDVFGNFHFQQIKNYLNTTYTTTVERNTNNNYDIDFSTGQSVYSFQGTKLISTISNSPQYSNIKNDFVVWGVRKSADDQTQTPIRYHLAIDKKPDIGQTHYASFYTDDYGILRAGAEFVKTYGTYEDMEAASGAENTLYIIGDLVDHNYWRYNSSTKKFQEVSDSINKIVTKDWRQQLYYQGIEAQALGIDTPYYYAQLLAEWPKLYNLSTQEFYDSVVKDPSSVDYWLDIIDDAASVGQYSVSQIGRRSSVTQQDQINCVFQQSIPDLVFIDMTQTADQIKKEKDLLQNMSQPYYQAKNSTIWDLLSVGYNQNSCYERICEELYQYTDMNQSISMTAIPLYWLDVNKRITVTDQAAGVNGDYMITSISLPLDVGSTMSIQAYRCDKKK